MKDDLTDITLILDRSGSMTAIRDDIAGGMNSFVAEQQKLPGEATFTLVQFDNEYEMIHKGLPIKDVPTLTLEPRGSTALLDAIGRTINETGARLGAIPETDRPGKVLMVILTDGLENASREFTRDKVFELITHQREVYKWEFMFLGANQDAIAVGASMGVPAAQAMNLVADSVGIVKAFAASSRSAEQYRTSGVAPVYSDSDRKEQQKADTKVS